MAASFFATETFLDALKIARDKLQKRKIKGIRAETETGRVYESLSIVLHLVIYLAFPFNDGNNSLAVRARDICLHVGR